jgi:hypothetical protein
MKCNPVVQHLSLEVHVAIPSESDHKNGNQLVPNTQWLKSYPHDFSGIAGTSPMIYILSVVIAFQPEVLNRIM